MLLLLLLLCFINNVIVVINFSRPLKNSFLHTGHGSSSRGKSWGSPGQIDEVYLKNPMTPPGKIF